MKEFLNKSQGSVLITVIWILSLLAIFTLAINRSVSQEIFMGKWVRDRTMGRTIAKAGVERVLHEVQADEFLTFDTLNESWASNTVAFKEIRMGNGILIVSCQEAQKAAALEEGEGEPVSSEDINYGACDESGRLNLNHANELQLHDLILLVADGLDDKEATRIAQAIIDWRDADDEVMQVGAEENFYKAYSHRALPRNAPLETIDELRMIRGIDDDLFMRLRPYVTVYTDGKVNFNTAPAEVFQSLGLTAELADKIVEFRKGEDGEIGTEDDALFQIVEGITPALSSGSSFSSEEFASISNLITEKLVSVKSNAFRIQSIGRFIKNSTVFDYILFCVLTREGEILYWREETA